MKRLFFPIILLTAVTKSVPAPSSMMSRPLEHANVHIETTRADREVAKLRYEEAKQERKTLEKRTKLEEAEATRQLAMQKRDEAEINLDKARSEKETAKQNYGAAKQKLKALEKNSKEYADAEVELESAKAERDRSGKIKERAKKAFVDDNAWLSKAEADVLSIKTDEGKLARIGRQVGEKTKGYANIATIAGVPVALTAAGIAAGALGYEVIKDDNTNQESPTQQTSDISVEEVDAVSPATETP